VAKPVVDGIERDLQDQAPVLRINVRDAAGSQLAMRFGVRGVPTLVVWQGEEVLRLVGRIDKQTVVQAATP
jgi:thiol:disulfide interchange protein